MPLSVGIVPIEEIERAPKLQITVIEGTMLSSNISLNINAQGLPNSLRNAFDGCVFIGTETQNIQVRLFIFFKGIFYWN